jgi:hypothetical protein
MVLLSHARIRSVFVRGMLGNCRRLRLTPSIERPSERIVGEGQDSRREKGRIDGACSSDG